MRKGTTRTVMRRTGALIKGLLRLDDAAKRMLAREMVAVGRDLAGDPRLVPSEDVRHRPRRARRGVRRHAPRPSGADATEQQVDQIGDVLVTDRMAEIG